MAGRIVNRCTCANGDGIAGSGWSNAENMMDSSKQKEACAGGRRPYERPTLKVIELATDEVLGVGAVV